MALQDITWTTEFDWFAQDRVERGLYASAADVARAAMSALEREDADQQAKQKNLEDALEEGEASGIYEGDVFASVRRSMGWVSEG